MVVHVSDLSRRRTATNSRAVQSLHSEFELSEGSYEVRTCLKKLKRNKQTKTNKQQQKSKPYCILGSKTTQQREKNYFFFYIFL